MRNCLFLATLMFAALGEMSAQAESDLVARFHFVGTTQIAKDPKAGSLNEVGALPETAILRDLALQKFATTPYRALQKGRSIGTNDYSAQIRPILDDLLHAESYAEVRGPTNHVPELLLAVHLDQHRTDYWQTNLATILSAWTRIPVNKIQAEGFQGWELKKHHNPNCIRFIRAGDWTLFGWGQDDLLLQSSMLQRIKSQGRPVAPLKNIWLEAWVDWPRITPYHPLPWPIKLPEMQLTLEGKTKYVRTDLEMRFPDPLKLPLEPWRIPTNIIHGPITSFTAMRGIAPLLNHFPQIQALNAGSLPDQAIIWAPVQSPFETIAAMPVQNGTNYLKKIEPGIVSMVNSNFESRHLKPRAAWTTNSEIALQDFPFLRPYLRAIRTQNSDYLLGGVMPQSPSKDPLPPALLQEVMSRTNLVLYDWEITEQRLIQWRPLSQLCLIASRIPPPDMYSPIQKWLFAAKSKMQNCGTTVTLDAPNKLSLVRNSTIGFSGVELTWLALWLGAPNFPLDAHYDALTPPANWHPQARPAPAAAHPAH